ncbi:MAG: CBS domain-containing protein [Chromatiales bacterium]|jgi:CBS-domain-containing membrane protein
MTDDKQDDRADEVDFDPSEELELSDDDILDAMGQIPGYLDISTEDFREIYHLAHEHALKRLFGRAHAGDLMRTGLEPVGPETPLDQAAQALAAQKLKSIPVVDADQRVVGMLTETDFLRRLEADTFLELLLRLVADSTGFSHCCKGTPVHAAMTAPAVTVTPDAGLLEIANAFHGHPGRSMPVVDADGRLLGLIMRKDFIGRFRLGAGR